MSRAGRFSKPFRVTEGRKFRLKDVDPGDTGGLKSKEEVSRWLKWGTARLTQLQEKLYAQDCWGLLLIFQAMDAAGKDGTIKHVMSGVNPQGCQVYSFKAPSSEDAKERDHWREYMRAYEDMIRETSAPHAPWYVVPADHKWVTRLVVGAAVIHALEQIDPRFPHVGPEKRKELVAARAALEGKTRRNRRGGQ